MAYALVGSHQTVSGGNGGTSSSMDTTGASLLVLGCGYQTSSALTVSDSKSNTWQLAHSEISGSTGAEIYYAENPTVGSGHTFTLGGSGLFIFGVFAAFSGALTTSPLDQAQGDFGTGYSDPAQPGTLTPTEDDELVLVTWRTFGQEPSSVTGYTFTDSDPGSGGVNYGSGLYYQIQTTATGTNPAINGVSGGLEIAQASFKAAAAAAGFDPPLLHPPAQSNVYRM
jgi:hypothetical protein